MVNRIIIAFASILSSGVLAYAHLMLYWQIQSGNIQPTEEIAHIQSSLPVLERGQLLTFGLLFFGLCCASLVLTFLKKHKTTFACFVVTMLLIWVRMWAGI
ncbi:hypothetical protein [Pleomorphovibrio marinus]|uniref:hypothetical protein n=1 Tax=Pleomorphovibrio marinus TaxID=2164132 RepID=UPI000E0A2687|nr:hypothetical protein [Pleomorphovibrio marinus]